MLVDTQCRNAKSKDKPYKLKDEKGLYLEVKTNGVKSWRYRFELSRAGERKESIFAIGDYGVAPAGETAEQAASRRAGGLFTLTEARYERDRARGMVKQGINPVHHRQLEKIKNEQAMAITFEAVAKEWVGLRDWEEITKKKRLQMLERVVFPHIGKLPVRQIMPAHILDLLKKASTNNGASVAAEAKRTMSSIYDLAISTLRAETDPVYPVRKALPPNKTQHKRAMGAEEIGQLLRDIAGYERNFQVVASFRFLWLTLGRPIEVIGAEWSEVDLETGIWRIPAEKMKMRKEHIIPLSRQAIELLTTQKRLTGHRKHVFPHRDKRDLPMTTNALRQALFNLGWAKKYSPHATRTTGSTRLNEMGFHADWIERQLAHTGSNALRRTYNHATYLSERKSMLQQWADMLDTWQSGAKILAFNKDVLRLKESA